MTATTETRTAELPADSLVRVNVPGDIEHIGWLDHYTHINGEHEAVVQVRSALPYRLRYHTFLMTYPAEYVSLNTDAS